MEAATGPTTHAADKIPNDRGTIVVPDILANAGGVVVGYSEWVRDLQCFLWDEAEADRNLKPIMV